MITLSKKLFCMILLGLVTIAVASLCTILHLPMDKAVVAFVVTWLALVTAFQFIDFENHRFPH